MKITESQLRKIIREELEAVREVDDLSRARAAARDESLMLRNMLVATPMNPDGYAKRFLGSMLPVGDKQAPAVALANLGLRVSRGQMTLDDAKAKFMEMYPQPINEEKLEPGLDVIANLFKDYRAEYGVNFDRFLFYVRQMLKKEGIDAKQLANKEDMKATIKSIAQDAGAMLKMAKKKDRLPLRR